MALVPLAENVTKLTAVCVVCQRDASFSMRISPETDIEVIGGADKYASVCRDCFNRWNEHTDSPILADIIGTSFVPVSFCLIVLYFPDL